MKVEDGSGTDITSNVTIVLTIEDIFNGGTVDRIESLNTSISTRYKITYSVTNSVGDNIGQSVDRIVQIVANFK